MPTSRERRGWKSLWGFLAVTLLLTALAVGVRLLRVYAPGHAPGDFLNGLELGLPTVLPVIMGLLLYRTYRRLDEYGQRVQERAAGAAFVLSMVATVIGYAAQSLSGVDVPLWSLYLFGMLVYTVSVVVQRRGE